MITLTLRYPEDTFPRVTGEEAAQYWMSLLTTNPDFAVKAATEVEVKGPFGKKVEQR